MSHREWTLFACRIISPLSSVEIHTCQFYSRDIGYRVPYGAFDYSWIPVRRSSAATCPRSHIYGPPL